MHYDLERVMGTRAPFSLPPLPYANDALDPAISAKTLTFHHDKHHAKYVNTTNDLVKGTPFEKAPLEQIIKETAGNPEYQKLFNNAGQSWNHWFYWNSLSPQGGGTPSGTVRDAIEDSFGSYDQFVTELSQAAVTQFGSGWAWLVRDGGKVKVMKTPNADNPIAHGVEPLLTIDVWEHAYYLDYQNRRKDYAVAVITKALNWEFAGKNFR